MTFAFDAETARGLVIRCRKDWDPRQSDGAIARARVLRWDDRKIARVLLQVLMDDGATPQDLAKAVDRDRPLTGGPGIPANEEWGAARDALARQLAGIRERHGTALDGGEPE